MNQNKTCEQRLEKSRYAIMRHEKFCAWAGLLYVGTTQVVEANHKIQTAGVDRAGNSYYNRAFMDAFDPVGGTDVYVNFVVLHETGHKALLHLQRHPELWKISDVLANIAADEVVNNLIYDVDPTESFAKMPVGPDGKVQGCRNRKYAGWSFKEVFNDLLKQVMQNGPAKPGEQGIPLDLHDLSGDAEGTGEKQEMSEEALAKVQGQVENALRQGQYLAGKMGAKDPRLVGDLNEPKLDWKELLSEFVQEACQGDDEATWRRPNKRFVGNDEYFPSYITETMGEVVACLDTSGSIGGAELNAMLAETVEVCRVVRPSKLRVIYWSDGIAAEEIYTPEQYDGLITATQPKGGGGTTIGPVARHVAKLEEVQCAIILTDGHIFDGWGDWGEVPTLWCITTRGIQAGCGKSLHLEV